METDQNPERTLQEFAEKLRHLEEENRHLREASHTFGQLAERLNATLQQELRKTRSHGPDADGRPRPFSGTASDDDRARGATLTRHASPSTPRLVTRTAQRR